MKLNLYEDKNIKEEKVDIHFTNMRPVIKQLIDTVKSERPTLSGRPADEDLGRRRRDNPGCKGNLLPRSCRQKTLCIHKGRSIPNHEYSCQL